MHEEESCFLKVSLILAVKFRNSRVATADCLISLIQLFTQHFGFVRKSRLGKYLKYFRALFDSGPIERRDLALGIKLVATILRNFNTQWECREVLPSKLIMKSVNQY